MGGFQVSNPDVHRLGGSKAFFSINVSVEMLVLNACALSEVSFRIACCALFKAARSCFIAWTCVAEASASQVSEGEPGVPPWFDVLRAADLASDLFCLQEEAFEPSLAAFWCIPCEAAGVYFTYMHEA